MPDERQGFEESISIHISKYKQPLLQKRYVYKTIVNKTFCLSISYFELNLYISMGSFVQPPSDIS